MDAKRESQHLLLVEDNFIALQFIETLTKLAGFRFTSTGDGESALKLAKTESFDLIITDISLPGISGLEMTRALRQWEKEQDKPNIPIIGLTAHNLQDKKKEAFASGMCDILSKPIQLKVLKQLVQKWIS